MKKRNLLCLVFSSLMIIGCGSTNSSSTNNSSSKVNSSNTISSSEIIDYGTLTIEDLKVYLNYPGVAPTPVFSNDNYQGEITYSINNEQYVKYENGVFVALVPNRKVLVTASTPYHKTTFKVQTLEMSFEAQVQALENKWVQDGELQGGTLFVGDSFFDTYFWSDFYSTYGKYNTRTHGIGGTTTTEWEVFASRLIYPVNPKNIVMHLGTNNLYDDKETSSEAYKNTVRLLETIHSRLPETKVYYFAIEPRTYAIEGGTFSQTSFDKIDKVNKDMEAYCNVNDYMVYVDATSECYTSGINVNANFFRDGIHPKLGNYMTYVNLLKEAGLELNINEGILNTKEFNIPYASKIGDTNNIIKVNGLSLVNNYSVKGKFKVTNMGGNAHIQFSLDSTNFQNRFLLWDDDSNGTFIPAYAISGNHLANQGNANVTKDVEATFEVVTTEKHSYFYVNGSLEFVFLNVNAKEFMIGGENVAVSFYDIDVVTKAGNEAEFNNVLARSEVNKYETSTDTTKKAIVI